jgi:hypothetical protein
VLPFGTESRQSADDDCAVAVVNQYGPKSVRLDFI